MIKLSLDDSRRLTGKNLVWDNVGAIIDTFVSGIDKQHVVDVWQKHIACLFKKLDWQQQSAYRIFENGISFLISAPRDCLFSATEINEAAWNLTCQELQQLPALENLLQLVSRLKLMIEQEANPKLLILIDAAEKNKVPWLMDEESFSLGFGKFAQIWPIEELPGVTGINWQNYQSIPVAMITGTNGKSTTVRLTSMMVQLSGKNCGVTSTDFVRVANKIIDQGDYSGPVGASLILRHPETEVALLEVARGGLLRRGLSVPLVDAALITNIAEDHFGEYGITNLDALTQAKCIVTKAVTTGRLVLNADDAGLVKASKAFKQKVIWFSLDPLNPILLAHHQKGNAICYLKDSQLIFQDETGMSEIADVNEVPITLNGAAKYNIQNALGAIGLAKALNIETCYIRQALIKFNSDMSDNPGRGNRFDINGSTVFMDFAHNTHSMTAMAETIKQLPAKRIFLQISAAGDRADKDIMEMTAAAMTIQPNCLVIAEVEPYLRGRQLKEVPQLIATTAIALGQQEENIIFVNDPLQGAKLIAEKLQPDDLALLLVFTQREEIAKLLTNMENEPLIMSHKNINY